MDHVIEFWFRTLNPSDWYSTSDDLDVRIKSQFEDTYYRVVAGETSHWRDSPSGRLAEIIVIDQFARNIFRDSPLAFNADPIALILSQEAIRIGADKKLDEQQRPFLYMPFMHSESVHIHEQAMKLFDNTPNAKYETDHKAIIDRFGRYPHRNAVLGQAIH
ncbi:MAG: hypothetical protein ACI9BW_003015 [Gammaproteobacteria bacterium]|jgi:uncharacterized protein (DUF924 family)